MSKYIRFISANNPADGGLASISDNAFNALKPHEDALKDVSRVPKRMNDWLWNILNDWLWNICYPSRVPCLEDPILPASDVLIVNIDS